MNQIRQTNRAISSSSSRNQAQNTLQRQVKSRETLQTHQNQNFIFQEVDLIYSGNISSGINRSENRQQVNNSLGQRGYRQMDQSSSQQSSLRVSNSVIPFNSQTRLQSQQNSQTMSNNGSQRTGLQNNSANRISNQSQNQTRSQSSQPLNQNQRNQIPRLKAFVPQLLIQNAEESKGLSSYFSFLSCCRERTSTPLETENEQNESDQEEDRLFNQKKLDYKFAYDMIRESPTRHQMLQEQILDLRKSYVIDKRLKDWHQFPTGVYRIYNSRKYFIHIHERDISVKGMSCGCLKLQRKHITFKVVNYLGADTPQLTSSMFNLLGIPYNESFIYICDFR